MHHLLAPLRRRLLPFTHLSRSLSAHRRASKKTPSPPPPSPPKPPQMPETFTLHGITWEDHYSWMSNLDDKLNMRHMKILVELEDKYTEAVMSETQKLQSKLLLEMASRTSHQLSTPAHRWGPWLYYTRVEEGKPYPVLCRRLAALHEEFISNKSPAAGFDFTTGKKIEQKLVDYNVEADKFGGVACERLCEISPNHRYIANTMYDKDNDFFKLYVRDLNAGIVFNKPQAERVDSIAWAKDGQSLIYVVKDSSQRPYRMYCSNIGSKEEDILLYEEPDDAVYLKIRHTKDFRFVTVNSFCIMWSKVFLIDAADPSSGMTLVWEGEGHACCIVEHHQGNLYLFTNASRQGKSVEDHYLLYRPLKVSSEIGNWESVFFEDQSLIIEDAEFCDSHMVLTLREDRGIKLCAVNLPLPVGKGAFHLEELSHRFLPLPEHVSQIHPGPNYDYHSGTMRFTVSTPLMPDAVVDYELSSGKWIIIEQKDVIGVMRRLKQIYGKSSVLTHVTSSIEEIAIKDDSSWNDLSEFYACEHYDVLTSDGTIVPLTIVYSLKHKPEGNSPGLVHGHGAYGEILDKRWRSESQSLLDRGWVVAYADVRGGGGRGKKWHYDGRCRKKQNAIDDYIACCKFLINKKIVHEKKLAGWGYKAGGLLIAAAINNCPNLFHAAVLKDPYLDPTHTFICPTTPLTPTDYEELGFPWDKGDFEAIRAFSPYDNFQKDALYPSVLITCSLQTSFGVWEAIKWVARAREMVFYDGKRPIILQFASDVVEEDLYQKCKDSALQTAFLLNAMES